MATPAPTPSKVSFTSQDNHSSEESDSDSSSESSPQENVSINEDSLDSKLKKVCEDLLSDVQAILAPLFEKVTKVKHKKGSAVKPSTRERSRLIDITEDSSSYSDSSESTSDTDDSDVPNNNPMLTPSKPKGNFEEAKIVITQPLASTEHIKLSQLSIKAVKKFTDDIMTYKLKQGVALDKAVAYVDAGPRETICTVNRINRLQFYLLSNKELILAIQKCIRPPFKEDFARILSEAVQIYLPEGFEVTLPRFSYFYTQLKSFVMDFEEKLDFLSIKNAKNVPIVGNQKEGLISIFLSKLPEHFAKSMWVSLRDTNTKYITFQKFLEDFLAETKSEYKITRKTKKVTSDMAKSVSFSTRTSRDALKHSSRLSQLSSYGESPSPQDIVDNDSHLLYCDIQEEDHPNVASDEDFQIEKAFTLIHPNSRLFLATSNQAFYLDPNQNLTIRLDMRATVSSGMVLAEIPHANTHIQRKR